MRTKQVLGLNLMEAEAEEEVAERKVERKNPLELEYQLLYLLAMEVVEVVEVV